MLVLTRLPSYLFKTFIFLLYFAFLISSASRIFSSIIVLSCYGFWVDPIKLSVTCWTVFYSSRIVPFSLKAILLVFYGPCQSFSYFHQNKLSCAYILIRILLDNCLVKTCLGITKTLNLRKKFKIYASNRSVSFTYQRNGKLAECFLQINI